MSIRIGEGRTIELFKGYQEYLRALELKMSRDKQTLNRRVLPVAGSFINLPYTDVRNKYLGLSSGLVQNRDDK